MEEALLNFLVDAWNRFLEHGLLFPAIITTVLMALFRTKKLEGKADYLEAGMCVLFIYGIWFVMGYFGLPEGAAVIAGGFIGYLGTVRTSRWIADKLGIAEVEQPDKNGGE